MKPNILIIIADDATCNDLPLYGGQNVKTPNIDLLAETGFCIQSGTLSRCVILAGQPFTLVCIRFVTIVVEIILLPDLALKI